MIHVIVVIQTSQISQSNALHFRKVAKNSATCNVYTKINK